MKIPSANFFRSSKETRIVRGWYVFGVLLYTRQQSFFASVICAPVISYVSPDI